MTKISTVRAEGPWTHSNIHARGMSFHVVIAGDEPGRPTVILLHDFPLHWWSWRHQIAALAHGGYRVLAMDLRGMGGSDLQPGPVDLVELAEDVRAVASATGTTSYTLVGSGVGGAVAWTLAHMAPGELESVVTIAAPHPQTRRRRAASRAIAASRVDRELGMPLIRSRGLRDGTLVRAVLRTWAAPEHAEHMAEISEQYEVPLSRVFSANAALETQKAARTPSSAARKLFERPVTVPLLSVRGGRDGRINPQAYSGDTTFARRSVMHVEIPGAGHFPNEETPDEVTKILLDHLFEVTHQHPRDSHS
ncbi:alpha/beta fold hydrolase [Actinomyces minihominis]|uniref:alpha/beta fold hydrolase n=1 Tax=Actinomyces minihominis TaxID=2002838 RepID=UPI00101ADEBF|nr:alpha/beta hydrolase [Actinomyces minihominis]